MDPDPTFPWHTALTSLTPPRQNKNEGEPDGVSQSGAEYLSMIFTGGTPNTGLIPGQVLTNNQEWKHCLGLKTNPGN